MLKFFHVVRISNFRIFLANLSSDFKHVVFSSPDELVGLPYIDEKVRMRIFQSNWNISIIPDVSIDIV